MRVVKHWNRLPRAVVDAPFLKTFEIRLDGALSNLLPALVVDVPAHCRGAGLDNL